MSDYGRLNTFKFVNAENRIKAPMIRKDGELMDVGWDEAVAVVASKLKALKKNEIAAIGSAHATNEDNYLLVKLMHHLGVKGVQFLEHTGPPEQDALLLRLDKTPNSCGAMEVGLSAASDAAVRALARDITDGRIKVLDAIDDNVAANPVLGPVLSKLDFLVIHASNEDETTNLADAVLSSSTYAEKHGTFTNFEGRVQRIRPAVATAEQDRALDGFAMSRLDKFGAHNDRWTKGARRDARPSWRILSSVANAVGAKWRYTSAEDVFNEIAAQIEAFKGMSYLRIGARGMMLKKKEEFSAAARIK